MPPSIFFVFAHVFILALIVTALMVRLMPPLRAPAVAYYYVEGNYSSYLETHAAFDPSR